MFFLLLFTLLQLQTFETDEGLYILIQSESEDLTFSSYRLNNPERIILEINGSIPATTVSCGQSVKSVKISEQAGITRFIFETKSNTQYTVLNKSNAILIGFSQKLFLGESNFDKTLAKVKASVKPEEKVVVAQAEVKTKAPDESKLVSNFLKDLKSEEETKKKEEEKRLAEIKRQEKQEKQIEEKKRIEEEKKIAELKRQEELKKQEIARKKAEEKRLAELKRQEELKRIELERKEEENRKLAELKRLEELKKIQLEKKKAREKKLAELKRQEELKKQEIARKKAEEKRLAELKRQEEQKRIEQEKKETEKRRLAELKRQEELKRIELERKKAEEQRLAQAEKQRLAQLKHLEELKKIELERKKAEEQRLAGIKKLKEEEEKRLAELKRQEEEQKKLAVLESKKKEQKKLVKTDDGKIRNLKVTKAVGEKTLSEERPELPVKKLVKKGTLKNIYFRKFADFSRVTLEISGDTEYKFREIKGGYVIDVHNFKKIPRHLLNIIDARAFNAQVKYIFPKKVDNILKVYIKTDKGIAVRKSEEGDIINFDFFEPTLK